MGVSTDPAAAGHGIAASSRLEPRPWFDVYGYRFTVTSTADGPLKGLLQDFGFFRLGEGGPAVSIELEEAEPDYSIVPPCDASIYTPRNVVYRYGGRRYIDYGGRGLGIWDRVAGRFRVVSRDLNLLYEAAYLFLLSQIGAHLDRRGIHRLHALGVELDGRAILVLLPAGGGKSTVCTALMERPEIRLLSDDSPLIDRRGRVLAFPLHLGLRRGQEHRVPARYRRVVERMEFGPKTLVSLDYYRGRVAAAAEPGLVLLGRRTTARECRLERARAGAALRAMIANCVVGMGLYHGLEFLLQSSAWELASKAGLGLSRLRNAVALLQRAETYVLHMAREVEPTAAAIVELAYELFR